MWCLFFSWFLAYKTNLFAKEPYTSMAISIAFGKLSEPYGPTILKGIGANSLVCIGVTLGTIARSDLGKVVLIFIPIATFATIGTIITFLLYIPIDCYHLIT
jgi:formate/nitrite transporter FocA (FNT family)